MLGPSPPPHSFLVISLRRSSELTFKSVTIDDQVKAYIKKIMSQLNKWMTGGKISKLVIVITNKETGENVERWQFDVTSFPLSYPFSPSLLQLYDPTRNASTKTNWHFKRFKSSINPAKSPPRRNPPTMKTLHLRKQPPPFPSPFPISPLPPNLSSTNPLPSIPVLPPHNLTRPTSRSNEKSNRYSGKSPPP